MRPVCVTSARFNMRADILRLATNPNPSDDPEDYGEWVEYQDPITGDITRVWVPSQDDNPDTPDVDESFTAESIPCIVRGIVEGGVRAAGTTEEWGEIYQSIELVRMHFPANVVLSKRDRIVNIRTARGQVIWKEEEAGADTQGVYKATVFEVLGVTPILDPFGNHVESYALLERAEIQ
jgi:hypothetical protein